MTPRELSKSAAFLLEGCEMGLFDEYSEEPLTLMKLCAEKTGVTLKEAAIDVLSKAGISYAKEYDDLVTLLKKIDPCPS